MEIQQKDSETLTAYIHRFKKEAKHCDFDSHPAKIRIFLKGLINSSRITPSVYKKGPTTIEDAIRIVKKISSAQCIAASFSHQKAIITTEDNHHALDIREINVMTGEATAYPMLGCTQGTEAQVTQDTPAQTDTPAGTGTQNKGTHRTATELKADHPTDSGQVAIDHRLPTLGIILEADHPHTAMRSHIDIV